MIFVILASLALAFFAAHRLNRAFTRAVTIETQGRKRVGIDR